MATYQSALLVIGAGGMGLAIARRLGSGQRVILADFSSKILDAAASSLRENGHDVTTQIVDVSSYESVSQLATSSSVQCKLNTVVNTAGISPGMGAARRIYEVDLLGTANVIDAFLDVLPSGASLINIASIAGHYGVPIPPDLETHLATASRAELFNHKAIDLDGNPAAAYAISKKGNILRAQAAIPKAATKGVRLNTVSPGVITTAMIREELQQKAGETIRQMIEATPVRRAGTAEEIASVVAFLAGPEASYVNGADLVVDGGFLAQARWTGGLGKME